MPIPQFLIKMDYYRKLLTEDRSEYKVSAQIHMYIKGEEVNIGIKDVERAIMPLKNGRMYGLKSISAELLEDSTEKLYQI